MLRMCMNAMSKGLHVSCANKPGIIEHASNTIGAMQVCACVQVSAAERENARNARLDALENDDAGGGEGVTGDSDEEFVLQDSDDGD